MPADDTSGTVSPELARALGAAYTIERKVGEGGMASVYLARDVKHRRRVALKLLRPEFAASIGVERFRREIRIAANLSHPNILPLYDSVESADSDPLCFVMPFVDGDTLRSRLARGPLFLDDALRVTIDVAGALDYAHRQGIVHRDIKPENILLLDDHAVVTDFGIAHAVNEAAGERLTITGMMLGTPNYLSPEQIDGARSIDGRSDIFSLGVVLYEAIAGVPPFAAPTITATLARVAEARVPAMPADKQVPADVAAIIEKSLARDPADRFTTARELSDALNAARARLTVAAQDTATRAARGSRGVRTAMIGVVALAVLAVGVQTVRSRARGTVAGSDDLPSIAILPFVSETADTSDAYVGAGIAEELLNALGDVPGIRVAPRTSSFAPRSGAATSAREFARQLNVRTLLEGSVRRSAGVMRVTARLIDASEDKQVWSANFDTTASGVFEVQERIAKAIVERLRGKLGVDTIVHRRTSNPRVHDLVLRATALFRDGISSRAEMLASAALLDTAARLDSSYAEIPALQAVVYQNLAVFHDQASLPNAQGVSAGEMLRSAALAARRAVALDPQSAAAHAALAQALFRYDWDWPGADAEYQKAFALNPTSSATYALRARFLRSMGRFDETRRELDSVSKYDPSQRATSRRMLGLSRASFFAHDFDRSARESGQADSSSRTWLTWAAENLMAGGRVAAAESLLAGKPPGEDPSRPLVLALIAAKRGRVADARAILEQVRGTDREFPPIEAAVYMALGDTAAAIAVAEHGVAVHDPLVVDYKVTPWFDPLRKNPRFAAMYARLRFP